MDDNIAYGEYIAENLDKTVAYAGLIAEKLNNNKINESYSSLGLPTLEEWGFETENDVIEEEPIEDTLEVPAEEAELSLDASVDTVEPTLEVPSDVIASAPSLDAAITIEEPVFQGESATELSNQIDKLISEASKRKIVETNDLHFLKFLNKSQVDSYYSLTNEDQETVKLHVNGKNYFDGKDVLRLIQEALSVKNETLENKVIRLMPDNIKPIWENLNESVKKSVLSQAKLFPNLTNETVIEHFWNTRNITKTEVTKKLVSHDSLIQEDTISKKDMDMIMEKFRSLK